MPAKVRLLSAIIALFFGLLGAAGARAPEPPGVVEYYENGGVAAAQLSWQSE